MIKIGKPYTFEKDGRAYLKADVSVSEDAAENYLRIKEIFPNLALRLYENYPPLEWEAEDSGLWFSVPAEYSQYLTTERSDAFIVALLYYAMITGSDIEYETEASERLMFRISHHLIPALCRDGFKRIRISGPVSCEPLENAAAVGTGMSCGVDALYTLADYTRAEIPESRKLTHLVYNDMGYIFHLRTVAENADSMPLEEFYSVSGKISAEKRANAAAVAARKGLAFIDIDSNLDRDYYRGLIMISMYKNISAALAVQKLFARYYCASGGAVEDVHVGLNYGSQDYELLLADCMSTESLEVSVSDYLSRTDKMEVLADDDIAKQYLDVCWNFRNCGECMKCIRTLLNLDILGKLDDFSERFDIEKYMTDRDKYWQWMRDEWNGPESQTKRDPFGVQLHELAEKKGRL